MKQKLEDPQETRQNILGEGVLFSFGCARCAGMVGVPFVKNCVVLQFWVHLHIVFILSNLFYVLSIDGSLAAPQALTAPVTFHGKKWSPGQIWPSFYPVSL